MNNINFYDPSLRYRRDWTGAGTALALMAASAALLAAIGLWIRHDMANLRATAASVTTTTRLRMDTVATLETRFGHLKADAALETRLLALQSTLAHRQADLTLLGSGALRENGGYSTTLLALARQSVDSLWLTGLSMERGGMTLRGRTFRPELIAVYVGRLNGEAVLRGQVFRELDIRRPVDEAAIAPAAPEVPAGPQPASSAQRRLAPYVEFVLTGGREADTDVAPAGTNGGATAAMDRKP